MIAIWRICDTVEGEQQRRVIHVAKLDWVRNRWSSLRTWQLIGQRYHGDRVGAARSQSSDNFLPCHATVHHYQCTLFLLLVCLEADHIPSGLGPSEGWRPCDSQIPVTWFHTDAQGGVSNCTGQEVITNKLA